MTARRKRRKFTGLWESVAELEQKCPLLLPARVLRTPIARIFANAGLDYAWSGKPDHFVIRIADRLDEDIAIYFLMHEWAHCLAWHEGDLVEHHGPEWGLAMARVHQALIER